MNREETKFLVVNTEALWNEGTPEEGRIIVGDKGILLSTENSYVNAGSIPVEFAFLDFSIDRCGIFYLIDPGKTIVVFDKDNNAFHRTACLSFTDPRCMTLDDSDIFIVDGDKLVCLARVNYQTRWEKPVEKIGDYDLIDAACTSDFSIYFLYKDKDGNGKIKRWSRRRQSGLFEFESIDVDLKQKGDKPYTLQNPLSMASDGKYVFVLYKKAPASNVLKIDTGGLIEQDITLPLPEEKDFNPAIIAVHNKSLYVSDKEQIVSITPEDRFSGSGTYITKTFDSAITGCRWHKIVLDMELPKNTRIELSFSASDDYNSLPSKAGDPSWSQPLINPSDALLLQAKGQYLRFRIELFSDDLRYFSPQIKALKAEFPHHSYLRYLPAVYQEDEAGREFLSRFLPLFETFFSDLEEKILSSTRHLDADAAPDEFLPWLGQWLALSRDENWPPEKLRKLIKESPRLYRMRGTREGIEETIRLYIDGDDQAVIIIENFKMTKCQSATISVKETNPYGFCIFLRPFSITSDQLQTVRRIVNAEKPAHTAGHVRKLEPWFYLDGHTYLEINSILTEPVFVLGESILSRDTALSDREWAGQSDVRSRIGEDTKLT